jgi:hypothetical protein
MRAPLWAGAAVAFAALAASSATAEADSGDEADTSGSGISSSSQSITSGPVSGSSSGTIVRDDKPVGALTTPGVDTSSDVVKTELKPTYEFDENHQRVPDAEWIPEINRHITEVDINVRAERPGPAPIISGFDEFFGVSPRDRDSGARLTP